MFFIGSSSTSLITPFFNGRNILDDYEHGLKFYFYFYLFWFVFKDQMMIQTVKEF
jgi:hypothetical protein